MIKLNLGCGHHKIPGFVGIDTRSYPEVDIDYDLEKGIPFANNTVDEVYASHVMEHLADPGFVLDEIHRVCEAGARIEIKIPLNFPDPAHKMVFQEGWEKKYFNSEKFEIVESRTDHIKTKSWRGVPFEYDQSTIVAKTK